jgi:hypothetical protein
MVPGASGYGQTVTQRLAGAESPRRAPDTCRRGNYLVTAGMPQQMWGAARLTSIPAVPTIVHNLCLSGRTDRHRQPRGPDLSL